MQPCERLDRVHPRPWRLRQRRLRSDTLLLWPQARSTGGGRSDRGFTEAEVAKPRVYSVGPCVLCGFKLFEPQNAHGTTEVVLALAGLLLIQTLRFRECEHPLHLLSGIRNSHAPR